MILTYTLRAFLPQKIKPMKQKQLVREIIFTKIKFPYVKSNLNKHKDLKMQKIYQFLLAGIIGIEFVLGIIVAPAIFFPKFDGVLTHFQSGIIMSEIFSKFSYILLAISAICLLYDLLSTQGKYFRITLSTAVMILSAIFVFYFCFHILQAQMFGESATLTPDFKKLHTWSEYTLKAILILQILLFFTPFHTRRLK